ncbi:MAG TPA: SDR family NAD(P)-dependent oxidoreductase [Pyrinomonadaceae bacterium]|jgi:NAD(P)-dependent dehydrogenase (short-subunit alcohol dehydrogenase family)
MNLAELTKMYDFTGRTVVVTGGTGVLGQAMVRAIVGCGANVALVARNREKAEPQVASLEGPGRAVIFTADVLDAASLREAAREVVEEFGRVDALLNGAGGNHPGATTNPQQKFFDLPEDALRFVFDLNMLGTIIPSQVFGRQMAEQGAGVILNVSSMSAVRPLTRVLGYSAAKAGVNSFTQWLAVHLATEYSPRIRVNAIAPGFFLTEQNRFLLTDKETGSLTARGQSIIAHTPMGRFGEPGDLLGTLLWLLSPASDFVTGVVVPVDGGFSAFGGV